MLRNLLIALPVTLLLATATMAATEFHVSPNGDDNGDGTAAQPFSTIEAARDAVRETGARAGAVVTIHGGTYHLPEPLEFTEADSGTEAAPVIYRAAEGEEVWLNGGVPLSLEDFSLVSDESVAERLDPAARDRVRQIALPDGLRARISPEWPDTWWNYRRGVTALTELFAGDSRLPMARWPNEGYAHFGEIVETADEEGETPIFRYQGDRPERWVGAVAEGVWLYGYWRRGYRAELIRIKSIDTEREQIELAARNSLGTLETGGASRYCAMHVLEELDAPGEWYLDRQRDVLFLWPPDSSQTSDVVISVNPTAVLHCIEADHIEFRGLGIECSAGSGIRIDDGTACRVVGCEVRNVGVHGIAATGDHIEVVGCDIHDTGDKAVDLDSGDRYTLTRGESVIDNCHMHHTNRIVRAGSQAVSLLGVGNRLSHNLIHDTGYIAVRFAGNDHVLEHNRLFRTNVESAEGGVFYTGRDWTSRGTVIRHNFIHHVEDTQEGCGSSTRFLHLDDSAPGIEVYGNVCYRMGGGVSICGGAANNVHDNLFVECAWGVDIGPRGLDMFEPDRQGGYTMVGRSGWASLAKRLERYKWNEPPYSTRYPKLVEIFTKRPIAAPWFNTVTRNVMVECGRGIRSSNMEPEWSVVADNWVGEDPGFVEPDHTKLDFRLREDAVACEEIGVVPPDIDRVGLYASPDRRSWPVALDLPPADWKPRWMRLREEAMRSPTDLPVFRAMQVTGEIVIDGVVDPMEWTPGDATGRAPEIHDTAELVWNHTGEKANRSSQAMVQTDGTYLYVAFRNEIDAAAGLSGGHRWGRDDAVEIALAEVKDQRIGPIVVLRGYADGYWESSDEAGAPPEMVARARRGVSYAAQPSGHAMWCAEWRIPFSALGLDPAARNPRLVFNLSVRKPAGDEWVMFSRKGGHTWDVHQSGFLWLAQFGDMSGAGRERPSQARIDLDARRQAIVMEPGPGCVVAAWARPPGCYLTAALEGLATDRWREIAFSFTPRSDGEVSLRVMGAHAPIPGTDESIPIWTYYDEMHVEGAELTNGSFEAPGEGGIPVGWGSGGQQGLWIHDPELAADGEYLVKTSHNYRFTQSLAVTAGRTVTISLKVRGVGD